MAGVKEPGENAVCAGLRLGKLLALFTGTNVAGLLCPGCDLAG